MQNPRVTAALPDRDREPPAQIAGSPLPPQHHQRRSELRRKGICVEVDYLGRSIKSQMREANRQSVQYVIVVGELELKTRTAKLKNMRTGEETTISLDEIKIPS